MPKSVGRWRLLVGLVFITMLVTACFQENPEQTDIDVVSQANISETPLPTATTQASDTPTDEALDQPIAQNPSDTPTATSTATPTATEAASTSVAQAPTEEDPFILTATQNVLNTTATVDAADTATQQALTGGITPTAVATDTQVPVEPGGGNPDNQNDGTGGTGDTGGTGVVTGPNCVHVVQAKQTMWRLSFNYGISVDTIAAANGITNVQLINVGQEITIPNCGVLNASLSPPSQFNTGAGGNTGGSNTGGTGGNVTYVQHTVEQYQTLFQISMIYGVPVQQIAAANGITNLDRIEMLQVLQIPVSSGSTNTGFSQSNGIFVTFTPVPAGS